MPAFLNDMQKILCITGPTASGKTSLAIALAKKLDGEIISCDSMQIYRGMDIGTAKPTKEELAAAPHHMIDVADPSDNYSCADYVRDAERCIEDIVRRGKTPIFCGGTGLYLESVLYQNSFEAPGADEEIRERLSKNTPEENHKMLQEIDPESAAAIHPNNAKRVIRALEIYFISGKTKSELDKLSRREQKYNAKIYTLTASDRQMLYDRIDKRVLMMKDEGLIEEVRALALDPMSTAGQAIGYKEISEYLRGEIAEEEAVAKVMKASRNYAKRQLTWWERNKEAIKIDICLESAEQIADRIANEFLSM
jgi:tRNA dimethylallyltransferase